MSTNEQLNYQKGLTKIDMQNKVVFIFDNDAEGISAVRKIKALGMPPNMGALSLPYDESFKVFCAKGPEGVTVSDINGRAAAIECYLDLQAADLGPSEVLWSNYKKDIDCWHGALQNKEAYTKHFLSMNNAQITETGYDTSKINRLLSCIVESAVSLISNCQLDD